MVAASSNMNRQGFVIVPPPGMTVLLQNQDLSPPAINLTPGSIQNGDKPLQTMYQTNQFSGGAGTAGKRHKGHRVFILRGSPKALGAIQILIGLVYLTFGSLFLMFMFNELYISYIMLSGYLYWGGILLIFSGSLLMLAERYQTSCALKGSLVLNIISSFAAVVGIFVFLVDILYFPGDQYRKHEVDWKLAQGLSNTILFFTVLEFITGILASRSCYDALYHQDDEVTCLMTDEVIIH
ncbi:membrane-spanning 4-domains subfamily A member 15-like [Heteronotia binoei]|uniref:membrane-spanning 4-domains subfamily A member 15-like n=1 Tax=Heteronotia binoei TaxID=13085 RepID=UPI002931E293|nr:membrane-spanning 4-domains subfamily A member 15-like [Heteronotia binoei]